MSDVIQVLVLSLHLILLNIAVGGPLICVWLDWRATHHDESFTQLASNRLAAQSLVALCIGVLLGVVGVVLISMAYPEAFRRAWTIVPPRRWMFSVIEIVFSGICVWIYLRWWNVLGKSKTLTAVRYGLPILASTNLAYHFAPLFAMVAVWSTRLTPPTEFNYLQSISDPEVASRTLHVLLASVAVAGVALMGCSLRLARMGTEETDAGRVAIWGARIALVPSLLQVFVGLYVLIKLPEPARDRMMGGDILTTALFVAALSVTLIWYYMLTIVSLGSTVRRDVTRCMSWMALVVVLMVAARHSALQPQYALAAEAVEGSDESPPSPESSETDTTTSAP